MKKTKVTIKEMSVKEYVNIHNTTQDSKITRYDVYDMIKEGTLKAHKGYKGAWVLEIEVEEKNKSTKKYSVKEFVEAYNEKHKKSPITVVEVRQLIATGDIKAKKVSGKWVISTSPSKRIK